MDARPGNYLGWLPAFFLLGAVLLSLVSIPTKIIFEVPLTDPIGYLYPVIFGGSGGLLGGWYYLRHRRIALQMERESRQSQWDSDLQLLVKAFDNTAEGIVITDAIPHILIVNKAFAKVTGYTEEEAVGQNPNLLQSGHHEREFYQEMWRTLQQEGHWQGEILNRRKSGEIYPQWLTISAVEDSQGKATHYVGVFTDISAIKEAEERLRYLATHDPLTDLPNRILFLDRLEHAIQRAHRNKSTFAVLFLDLDDFKAINDTYGHTRGDILLQMVGERLQASIRQSDTIARLGGDEFTILLEEIPDPETAQLVTNKIHAAFEHPFDLKGDLIRMTVSVGFSYFPQDGSDINSLLKSADLAMYARKGDHKALSGLNDSPGVG